MVERQLKNKGQQLLVVDLDGTLCRGNTLHIFIRCALRRAILTGDIKLAARIAAASAMRKLGKISHVEMKRRILPFVNPDATLRDSFIDKVSGLLNPKVLSLIERCEATGMQVLLASAAPEVYIPWIWHGDFVASRPGEPECRGKEKLRRVLEYAAGKGLVTDIVVTDHPDDLPLSEVPTGKVILVRREGIDTDALARKIPVRVEIMD